MATFNGTSGNDSIVGSAGDDILNGEGGNDTLFGRAGNDQLNGGDGDDFLRGEDGDDLLSGGAGSDFFRGGRGVDTFDGGSEDLLSTTFGSLSFGDRISFFEQAATSGVIADLRTGIIENDGFGNRETMTGIESLGGGTAFADYFYGNDARNLMLAGARDTMMGFGGDDSFQLGGAPALLDGGEGRDFLVLTTGGDLIPDSNGDGLAEFGPDMTRGWIIDLALGTIVDGFSAAGIIRGIERIQGSNLNDELRGSDAAEELSGGGGNDVLEGRGGNDFINARGGSDTADGGQGVDTLAYSDLTSPQAAYDYNSGAGAVHIDLQQGFAEEAEANKVVVETAERIEVSAGSGTIQDNTPRTGRDVVSGFENIVGSGLGDRLYGNDANNVITPGAGDDVVDGRGGRDTVDYSSARGGVTVNLAQGSAIQAASGVGPQIYFTNGGSSPSGQIENVVHADDNRISTDQLFNIENVVGSNLNDSITGDALDNVLEGRGGSDVLDGGAGNDTLEGGDGDDTLYGGDGDDTLRGGLGSDQLYGGAGNDLLSESSGDNGPFGDDLYDGGEGSDRVSLFRAFGAGVTIDLRVAGPQNTGSMGTDTFVSIEHITSNYGNDTLTGNDADNWFWTFSGTDNLSGNGGNDYFTVGNGDKTADGGTGVDTIEIADFAFEPVYTREGITVSLALQGTAQITGAGTWTLTNMENLGGNTGADELTGDDNANILAGHLGDDILIGGGGDDVLAGDGTWIFRNGAQVFIENNTADGPGGNDRLEGGAGNDTLIGGAGVDYMIGGTGDDIYFVDQAGVPGVLGDSVIESAGEGTDEIRTGINWGLGGTNVENITAIGTGNIFLGGNEVANVMTGNSGDNYFIGDGGNDTIEGAGGRDTAAFNLPAGTPGNLVVVDGTGADAGKLLVQLVDGANVETVARVTLNGNGSATVEGLGQGAFWGTDTLSNIEELHFLENTTDGSNAANIVFIFPGVRQFGEFVEGSDTSDTIDLATFAGAVNASGNRGDDTISGTEAVNYLSGGLGDDVLRGLGGNDSFNGDDGADTIEGGADNDYMVGGAGNDSIDGGTGTNDVASFQLPTGTPGTIAVVDGSGADAGQLLVQITDGGVTQTFLRVTLTGLGGAIVEGVGIGAFMGTDMVANVDQLHIFVNTPGGALPGQFVAVNLTPAQFGNFVSGSEYGDVIDLATYAGAVNANGNRGDDSITGTELGNGIQGGLGNDTLSGLGGNDFLNGQAGDDTLLGGADNDTLIGAGGSDTLDGGDGDDVLIGAFNGSGGIQPGDTADILRGGAGNDLLRGGEGDDVLEGGIGDDNLRGDLGNDTLDGGDGNDFVSYRFDDSGVTEGINFDGQAFASTAEFTMSDGRGGTDTLRNVEHLGVSGSSFADVIRGSDFAIAVPGGAFANQISGFGGDDQVIGGGSRDILFGGDGADLLQGLGGNDDMFGEAGDDRLDGGLGNDFLDGGLGADIVEGRDGDDAVIGGEGNDVLIGGTGSDFLIGGAGNDSIDGGTGVDDVATFYLPTTTVGTLRSVAGTGADAGRVFIERVNGAEVEVIAMITVTSAGAVVQGLGSAAFLGTDTLANVDRVLFSGVTANPRENPFNPDQYAVVQLAAGIVSDGYVAGSTVFIDANDNGLLDEGETSTVTDAEGNFAFVSISSGTIRAVGGINVDTGLPNLLTLTAPEGSSVINPLTTLVQSIVEQGGGTVSIADAQGQVLASLGLDAGLDLSTVDIVAAAATDPGALGAQRAAVMIATILIGAGEAAGAAGAAAAINAALENLATQVGAPNSQVDLTNSATITEIVSAGLPEGTVIDQVIALLETATSAISTAADVGAIADVQHDAVIALDQTAPGGPSLRLDAASDTGPSLSDGITADVTPTLQGLAEAGSTIRIFDAGVEIGSTVAGANGSWQLTLSPRTDGIQPLTATATDASGNQSISTPYTLVIDTVVAALARPDLATVSDSGISSSDLMTNDATPTILGGGAEIGATIRLFASDGQTPLGSAIVDANGNWSITSATLPQGAHSLSVRQIDLAGNVSTPSPALSVTIDVSVDAPAITSAARTYDSTPVLTGSAEAGAAISIVNASGTQIGTAVANQEGQWSSQIENQLGQGANVLNVIATDRAGNVSATTATTITLANQGPTLNGGAGSDNLVGSSDDDIINGLGGDDRLVGGAGFDTLDGGDGFDTAFYSGLFRSYDFAQNGGSQSVSGGAEGGTDTLTNIEVIEFKDGKFVFDAEGFAAQVTRLYDTVLQRAPDQAGLDLWVDRLEGLGSTLKDVAKGFLGSPEFQDKTGNLSNADYVEFLYQNALGRASDPGGKAAWTNQLDSGASDRADLLVGFSESAEHKGLTADLVSKGFFNTDDAYQAVALLYDSFAGRLPDASGLIGWAEAIRSGALTLSDVAAGFADSAEFRALTAGMSHEQLVDFMYQNTLDRGADPGGRAAWINALDAGLSDGDLLLGFSQSTEHFFLIGPDITNGIDYF